ncbi:hypothetical protein V493_00795 [Pseudogymnoascus sp. VKM F-4281 (FW-2241)]|nr:hypothetical protein V493_00795 [Pseudogymnoascus sp. VKM F-4281 (FW-2241)]
MGISKLPRSARPSPEPPASSYGLIEKEFASDDFQLLVVCIFLNKTKGDRAIPAARRLLLQYPKPEILANASYDEIKIYFRDLGLLRRASWLIELSKKWLIDPPQAGKIRKKMWGGSIQAESEVAHLQGVGLYASDAWRIFCKDNMYEKAGLKVMESEWKAVKPRDKKLRSYLIWRWAREGYDWDPETGVAIERSLEGSDCDLGMSCLAIDDSGGGGRLEQAHVSAYRASMALPKQVLEGAKLFSYDSKTQDVCQLEEVPVPLGCVLKGKAEGEPVATISDIATDGLMKRLADLGL